MELVAFVGKDRENLGQVAALINHSEAEKIILLRNNGAPNIATNERCKTINIDSTMPLLELKKDIQEKLKTELSKEFEVALSIASGTGKDHMATIGALLSIPVGIKLVAYTKKGIEFIS